MASLLPFRDINVHASASHYAFTSPSSPAAATLVVDRPSGDLRLNDGTLLGGKRVSSIAGILGMVKLRLDKYIIVITKAQPMGRLKGHMIYKVIATEFLPLRERPLHDQDEDTYLTLLKTFIKSSPMYFSYSFDITNTFQRQAQLDSAQPLWKRADDRFFWNKFIQSDLIDFRGSGSRQQHGQQSGADPYILPVIFGMLEIIPTRVKSTPLTMVLITRRSRHRAGTRYFSRGIDDEGHVSNFNETEQIILLNDSTSGLGGFAGGAGMQNGKVGGSGGKEVQIMSYVQTRGSVPVYWAEVNTLHYTPKLQIRGVETAVSAARAHFDEQIRIYGDNYLVNLVNQKGREKRVKDAYEQMVRLLVSSPVEGSRQDQLTDEKFHVVEPSGRRQEMDRLHYVYFDFHDETKGLKWHRAQLLLDQLSSALEKQQYFRGVDMPADIEGRLEVRNHQTSVVRTNCMDCLDRTNVVQSMLARSVLNRQLTDLGVLSRNETFTSADASFEVLFRKLWADNADVVSKSYSGTGALKTDFTRTGVRTKAGAIQDLRNSITRYARNNFLDGPKQDAFDLFLGAYLPSHSNGGLIFADSRPLLIQSIPYLMAFSFFFVFVGAFTRRLPDSAVLPVRIFILFWFIVGAWCLNFIYSNGMLYVNWPKLNPRPWAMEGYQEAISKVRKDKLIGKLVTRHERGHSTVGLLSAEEGKKRIE
ncbi:Recessive suppressor of secretory defect [Hyphodiscus hymeniophilus]|uniref:Recessive suppressor of secretory defect n=1 Tax=Hyphodiscus hymeniophilus TaxID=353542 RepID=A0A9P6VDU0_9HELO|nr:Recessive suppressor of secretory defect [Hyphodiscus hymeniophilus]